MHRGYRQQDTRSGMADTARKWRGLQGLEFHKKILKRLQRNRVSMIKRSLRTIHSLRGLIQRIAPSIVFLGQGMQGRTGVDSDANSEPVSDFGTRWEPLHLLSCILYLAFMRPEHFLIFALAFTACGGRSMNKHLARNLLVGIPQEALEREDIEVVNISQISGSEAIAETTLKAAFRFERVRGAWVVREVRLGHGQWEKVSNLVQALEAVKTEETRQQLDRIADAIQKYREANRADPVFGDYIGLSDQLSPKYLTPLIRLDAWNRPLDAARTDDSIMIRSAGPDGRFGTKDDLTRTATP
jgi:hypothetical protein